MELAERKSMGKEQWLYIWKLRRKPNCKGPSAGLKALVLCPISLKMYKGESGMGCLR